MRSATVEKWIEIDAGHRVPHHGSKCRSPHGHRYRFTLRVAGPVVDDTGRADNGMVVDFGVLRALLLEHVDEPWDHAMIVWSGDAALIGALCTAREYGEDAWKVAVVPLVPTAENLARIVFNRILNRLPKGMELLSVTCRETPTSTATWGRDARL